MSDVKEGPKIIIKVQAKGSKVLSKNKFIDMICKKLTLIDELIKCIFYPSANLYRIEFEKMGRDDKFSKKDYKNYKKVCEEIINPPPTVKKITASQFYESGYREF